MWQRFTERARKVVFYAQEEAGKLGETNVSTEHILLGLIRENDSVAARILDRMGISLAKIRRGVLRQAPKGDGQLGQDLQLVPSAKRVIDLAYDEARQLNNNYIGTEHILLGLIREGEGIAAQVLAKLKVDLQRTRQEVTILQDGPVAATTPADVAPSAISDVVRLSRSVHVLLVKSLGRASLKHRRHVEVADLAWALLEDDRLAVILDSLQSYRQQLGDLGNVSSHDSVPPAEPSGPEGQS